jgi:tetratricopeptide (TPR) repeat protein
LFSPDEQTLIVETMKQRCERPNYATEQCWRSDPHEELRFSMANGALISRADISAKYADQEKRLLHELDLVLAEHPPDELNLAAMVLELGKFYEGQKQYSKAKDYYEHAIRVYSRKFGADSSFALDARKRRAKVLRGTQKRTRITK